MECMSGQTKWLGRTVLHEGLPMALRVRPGVDSAANRERYPILVALTHKLRVIHSDGLPDATYNATLLDLDLTVTSALDADARGITVLIETFHGERTYYAYTQSKDQASLALSQAQARYPEHDLSVLTRPDPKWGLLHRYKELFPW